MTEPASSRPWTPEDGDDQKPETDLWTPGRVTASAWAPDRHDVSEARADR